MDRKKILVIDDEEAFGRMIKLNLEKTQGYEVKLEPDGKKALLAAKAFGPDLIFLDLIMPEMLGEDVMHLLKADDSTKYIPVVFLTASVESGEISHHQGVLEKYPYLEKPVSLNTIIDCIEQNVHIKNQT